MEKPNWNGRLRIEVENFSDQLDRQSDVVKRSIKIMSCRDATVLQPPSDLERRAALTET